MAELVVLEVDLWEQVRKRAKPKYIICGSLPVKVSLKADNKALKELRKDPLLMQKCVDATSKEYQKSVAQLKNSLVACEMACKHFAEQSPPKFDKVHEEVLDFDKALKEEAYHLKKAVIKAAYGAYEDHLRTQHEREKYKLKWLVSLSLDTIKLGYDQAKLVLGAALAPSTGGVSAVIGTISGVLGQLRTIVGIMSKVYKLCLEADGMRNKIERDLKFLKVTVSKHKTVTRVSDLTKATINEVFGADFLPTISSVKGDLEQYDKKLKGVDLSAHKAAKALNATLHSLDDLDTQIRKLEKTGDKAKVRAFKRQKMVVSERTNKLIESIIKLEERVSAGKKWGKSRYLDVCKWEKTTKLTSWASKLVVPGVEMVLELNPVKLGESAVKAGLRLLELAGELGSDAVVDKALKTKKVFV